MVIFTLALGQNHGFSEHIIYLETEYELSVSRGTKKRCITFALILCRIVCAISLDPISEDDRRKKCSRSTQARWLPQWFYHWNWPHFFVACVFRWHLLSLYWTSGKKRRCRWRETNNLGFLCPESWQHQSHHFTRIFRFFSWKERLNFCAKDES